MTSGDELDAVGAAETVRDLAFGVGGWAFTLTGALGIVAALAGLAGTNGAGGGTGAIVALLVSTLLVAAGLLLNPRFGRQLERRHSPATFGRTRTVDTRVVQPAEDCSEPCVACSEAIEAGVVRRRRTEFVVAGLPVYTSELEHTHYCGDCAAVDVFGTELPADADPTGTADRVGHAADRTDPTATGTAAERGAEREDESRRDDRIRERTGGEYRDEPASER